MRDASGQAKGGVGDQRRAAQRRAGRPAGQKEIKAGGERKRVRRWRGPRGEDRGGSREADGALKQKRKSGDREQVAERPEKMKGPHRENVAGGS